MATENLMAGTWTKAAKVRRAFKAGPRRKADLMYSDMEEAVLNGYAAFLSIRKEMHMEATFMPEGDVKAALVLMSSESKNKAGLVRLLSFPRTIKNISELSSNAERLAKKGMVPLGVVFWLRDREANSKATWVQAWLVNPRAARAAIAAQNAFEESDGQETEAEFEA